MRPTDEMKAAARTFETPSGSTISVGRDAAGNHALTLASDPDDYWLHAESFSGSHVVMDGSASSVELAFAADLAVHFSKARLRGRTPVTVARVRDVRTRKDGSAAISAPTARVHGNPMRRIKELQLAC